MYITDSVKYIGVNDNDIRLFEGQYSVPDGMAYNSYIVFDEKIAVMDSVEASFGDEWLENIRKSLNGRQPDYLIVQHMEPDHSANVMRFAEAFPEATVVATAKAFNMMKNFFGTDMGDRALAVADGDTLSLGQHELHFLTAPMVHWPEVMVTYDSFDKILFSADGFGKFGTYDADEPWDDEAARYYIGIVGKYGVQVQALLKKAAANDIKIIAPLHGPVLNGELAHYIELYDIWSSYRPEKSGVVIAYASIYGNTAKAAAYLAEVLKNNGTDTVLYDLTRCDKAEAVSDAFRYDRLVLASVTYNGTVFPAMGEYLTALTERGFKKRKVGFIENGSWAPVAAKMMKKALEECKELEFAETEVKIMSTPSEENSEQIKLLAAELCR